MQDKKPRGKAVKRFYNNQRENSVENDRKGTNNLMCSNQYQLFCVFNGNEKAK